MLLLLSPAKSLDEQSVVPPALAALQSMPQFGSDAARLVARLAVLPFFRDITDVVAIAFSTSSSAATLPVAMRVAEKNLGVSHAVTSTAMPLGVT